MEVIRISGVASTGAKADFLIEKYFLNSKKVIFIVNTQETAESIKEDILTLYNYFYSNFKKPEPVVPLITGDFRNRVPGLKSVLDNKYDIVVTTPEDLLKRTIPEDKFKFMEIKVNMKLDREKILTYLSSNGYSRVDFVESEGQFAVRGEILDFWSPQDDMPVRMVYYKDTVETIKYFDIEKQISVKNIQECTILPGSEFIQKELTEKYFLHDITSVIDSDTDILQLKESKLCRGVSEVYIDDYLKNTLYSGNFKLFLDDFNKWKSKNFKVVVFMTNKGEYERFINIMEENNESIMPEIVIGTLNSGYLKVKEKVSVITYHEIFQKHGKVIRFPKFKSGRILEGLWEILPGDYVVHERYGIGKYRGLRKVKIENNESEYLLIEYRGGDKLYVPIIDFHRVQKYIGVEGKKPRLYCMDSPGWEHAKKRAKESAGELAKELYEIYRKRKTGSGYSFNEDSEMERELADTFPYQETADQIRSIEDVKRDMKSPVPMDRLVLGDVGFGKTEVAIRAAFKCVISGKQVAVLTPTTVLSEQHYETFTERLSMFPVNIALLTRFQKRSEQKRIVEDIKRGLVDIVIGTHRILQNDVQFKNIGLLIIDDEHRFGVREKEKIRKSMVFSDEGKIIDVLSLTATPIPRTLSMALSGVKDISVIETPPEGRIEIETYIGPYSPEIVIKAIDAEINRGGQVFYIHNVIETIYQKTEYLKKLLPEVRFGILHGRMKSKDIEKTMHDFMNKKLDCIVATTIIEAGIDIPNVNTMIVENSQDFGLSQLYQLRGRIGRGQTKAYCYLFHSEDIIGHDAKRRLEAMYEFKGLGSGFRLALRDLEIRGAGEILGKRQHGFIQEVGLNLYCQYLNEEVATLKGEEIKSQKVPSIEINVPAYIPQEYVNQEDIRITFYRKFISCESISELDGVMEEIKDRFGNPPESVINIRKIVEIKILMKKLDISTVKEKDGKIIIEFEESAIKDFSDIFIFQKILDKFRGRIETNRGKNSLRIIFEKQKYGQLTDSIIDFIRNIYELKNNYAIANGINNLYNIQKKNGT